MLNKQTLPINFSQGLDTKSDPLQVSPGKFLTLTNTVFTKGGLLQKRNGFATLPGTLASDALFITTFGGNLTAIGSIFQAYSAGSSMWVNEGLSRPVTLSTTALVRDALGQIQCDSVTALNGLTCTVYTSANGGSNSYFYSISDSNTGQNIVTPTALAGTGGAVTGSPRVFLLGTRFLIVFTVTISGVSHLQYVGIATALPTVTVGPIEIAQYASASSLSWDGSVSNNTLYLAYNTTVGGQSVQLLSISSSLLQSAPVSFSGSTATAMSVCVDATVPSSAIIYAFFYDSGAQTAAAVAVDLNLNPRMTSTTVVNAPLGNVTCFAENGVLTAIYESLDHYSYDSSIPVHSVFRKPVTLPATLTTGSVGSQHVIQFSVGLASKAFLWNDVPYVLCEYASSLQSTYFLSDIFENTVAKFAYENGGASVSTTTGYLPFGLPQAQVINNIVKIPYLYADLIESITPTPSIQSIGPSGKSNVYSQTGVNVVSVNFAPSSISSSEIGSNLNVAGGFLISYDGQTVNENGFHLFPDYVETNWSTTGGSIAAQPDGSTNTNAYYYQVTYEWTDAKGNIIRSAPSVPVSVTTTGSGTTGSIAVSVPCLQLTTKTKVKIVIYRWSVGQQTYHQVTSITSPTLNEPGTDSITYLDTLADSSIVGNSIIYTTGGVVEDIGAPACNATALFDDRLWLIDAEDTNLLWYSKQVIEGTPVEMSDLFTLYIAPTTGAQGSTGPLACISAMDDKLIMFKENAIYYLNGTGPDNTGANSQYSQPIFVTSTVGSANQNSIILTPAGLMFQSDKGIWLLGRDLSTSYIGAPVEAFNSSLVNSALVIPGTNQVRFTLSGGITLMYDYYFGQWTTFSNIAAISSTLYQGLHTYLSPQGTVLQETPGTYTDNGNPTLMSFTTSWYSLANLQGFERAYFFYLLGTYYSPHKLQIGIAYDYDPSVTQQSTITPNNANPTYGNAGIYGDGTPYGGTSVVEQWRVFMQKQKCQAFHLTFNEIYDASFGIMPGAGFTLSGLNLVVATKKGYTTLRAVKSVG